MPVEGGKVKHGVPWPESSIDIHPFFEKIGDQCIVAVLHSYAKHAKVLVRAEVLVHSQTEGGLRHKKLNMFEIPNLRLPAQERG